jgi:acyl-CoA reductase-like NAD-dependent aldehyde dehydrogenase
MAPQVLININHEMDIMTEETFGPVVGIMPVESDADAINLMNDSKYGLTTSIWSEDVERAIKIGDQVETGTVFLNRCDYLDPALAWTGVKDSGRGCTLSKLGYDALTRPKSFHLKLSSH